MEVEPQSGGRDRVEDRAIGKERERDEERKTVGERHMRRLRSRLGEETMEERQTGDTERRRLREERQRKDRGK